jgi:hypothetical protein
LFFYTIKSLNNIFKKDKLEFYRKNHVTHIYQKQFLQYIKVVYENIIHKEL